MYKVIVNLDDGRIITGIAEDVNAFKYDIRCGRSTFINVPGTNECVRPEHVVSYSVEEGEIQPR